jgi:hypothetical protein
MKSHTTKSTILKGMRRFLFEESILGLLYNMFGGCKKPPEVFEMQELHACIYCTDVSELYVCAECRRFNMYIKIIATAKIQMWWREILLKRKLARIHEAYMSAADDEDVVPLLEDA